MKEMTKSIWKIENTSQQYPTIVSLHSKPAESEEKLLICYSNGVIVSVNILSRKVDEKYISNACVNGVTLTCGCWMPNSKSIIAGFSNGNVTTWSSSGKPKHSFFSNKKVVETNLKILHIFFLKKSWRQWQHCATSSNQEDSRSCIEKVSERL